MVLRWGMLLWCCLAAPAWADTPGRVLAVYYVSKHLVRLAEVEERYVHQGNSYQLNSVARPVGFAGMWRPEKIVIHSSGRVGAHGLQPVSFEYEREKDPIRSSRAEFNWVAAEVTLSQHTARKVLALPDGAQDRLSSLYQFMFLTLRPKQEVTFPLVNGLSLNMQHYVVAEGDTQDCGGEKVPTWYLDNQPKLGETHAEIWLRRRAPSLPCKVQISEANGEQLVQELRLLVVEP